MDILSNIGDHLVQVLKAEAMGETAHERGSLVDTLYKNMGHWVVQLSEKGGSIDRNTTVANIRESFPPLTSPIWFTVTT